MCVSYHNIIIIITRIDARFMRSLKKIALRVTVRWYRSIGLDLTALGHFLLLFFGLYWFWVTFSFWSLLVLGNFWFLVTFGFWSLFSFWSLLVSLGWVGLGLGTTI